MRPCNVTDCPRPHSARGYCASHYNQLIYKGERHAKVAVSCAGCGTVVQKYRSGKRRPVCSLECRYLVTHGRPHPRTVKTLVHVPRTQPARSTVPPVIVVPPSGRPFRCGSCAWCGCLIVQDGRVTGIPARWCSKRCARKAGKAARRAREMGATGSYTWAEVMRVYVALGRVCAYCHLSVEGQPDPDHVTPLSRGGRNSITNIVPCCRSCNSDKHDRTVDEWVAWRAERGKPTLPIDFTHPALRYLVLDRAAPRRVAA